MPELARLSAQGKHVIIIGGGDTGADCLGTAHRQGARSVHQFQIHPQPPDGRLPTNPWPQWSNVFRASAAHEEGGVREWSIHTRRFVGDHGQVTALETVRVEVKRDEGGNRVVLEIPGTEKVYPADLILLAIGYSGPDRGRLLDELGVELDRMGNVQADSDRRTNVAQVFVAGDMSRGQSLIVWAIAEGRHAAHSIDKYLMGHTDLPRPLDHGNDRRPVCLKYGRQTNHDETAQPDQMIALGCCAGCIAVVSIRNDRSIRIGTDHFTLSPRGKAPDRHLVGCVFQEPDRTVSHRDVRPTWVVTAQTN